MNEVQHDKKRELDAARAHFKVKKHELNAARRRIYRAQRELLEAVSRDPESWYGTPGMQDYDAV